MSFCPPWCGASACDDGEVIFGSNTRRALSKLQGNDLQTYKEMLACSRPCDGPDDGYCELERRALDILAQVHSQWRASEQNLGQVVSELRCEVSEAKRQREQLDAQVGHLQQLNEQLCSTNDDLSQKVSALEEELQEATRRTAETEAARFSLACSLETLTVQLEAEKAHLSALKTQVGVLTSETGSLEAQLDVQQAESEHARAERDEQYGAVLAELAAERQKSDLLKAEVQLLRDRVQGWQARLQQVEDEKNASQDAQPSACDLHERLRLLEAEVATAVRRAEDAERQKVTFEQAAKEHKANLQELKQQLTDRDEILSALRAKIERLERSQKAGRSAASMTDDEAIRRVADLLVRELPRGRDGHERQRLQRQLLACLHPDKCPSSRVATELVQEVQQARSWVPLRSAPASTQ